MLAMKTFRDALLARINGPEAPSLKAIAEGAGVSYEQLKKLKQAKSSSTNVEDGVAVARYFGLTLNEFLEDDLSEARIEIVEIYNRLTEAERQLLLDVSRVRTAPVPPEDR